MQVRDTAAWSLGRICQIMQDTVVNANVLQPLLGALVDGLAMEPRVATNACWVSWGMGGHVCMKGGEVCDWMYTREGGGCNRSL